MNDEPMPADQAADAPDAQPPTPGAAQGEADAPGAPASLVASAEEPGIVAEPEVSADGAEAAAGDVDPEAAAAALGSDLVDEGDVAFGEHLDPETRAFGAPKPQAIVCQWCNGSLASDDLELCPHCGSRLKPTDADLVVPGVTTLSAEAARALELVEIQRNREAAKSGQAMYTTPSLASAQSVVPAPDEATVEAANRPPDDEVRRLMLEMELEARQARAVASARSDVEAMIVADADVDPDLAARELAGLAEAEAATDAVADTSEPAADTAPEPAKPEPPA
ncbi:MAG TPA: zinc ribbon domain-containing protein [Candidatus Limnocylindrales bacterium]|jgi:hypothetical protein